MTDHKAEAEKLVDRGSVSPLDGSYQFSNDTETLLAAQVHATLALVEQQRIANQLRAAELRVDKPWVMADIERLGLS